MGRSEPILHFSVIVGCRDRRPGDSKRLKSHPAGLGVPQFPLIGAFSPVSWLSPAWASVRPFKPNSPEIASPVLRPALGRFGAHRKGHHRRFGRGGSSGAMGRAFVMVLNCSISSW